MEYENFNSVTPNVKTRSSTSSARHRAIARAIDAMRLCPAEPLSLNDLARIACMSPFHFNRVFRNVTGLPPCRFQTALRIEAAKRLLLATDFNVTKVCFEVGYESPGSFGTCFLNHVGVSPRALRQLADRPLPLALESDARAGIGLEGEGIRIRLERPGNQAGPVFLGLFPTESPHGRPVRCFMTEGDGACLMDRVPDGRWYLFAVSMPRASSPVDYLLPDGRDLRVARSQGPIEVSGGRSKGNCVLRLRTLEPTDPPILLALHPLAAAGFGGVHGLNSQESHQSTMNCGNFPETSVALREPEFVAPSSATISRT